MLKFSVKGENIYKPIEGKEQQIIDAFVSVYGEKYRELIDRIINKIEEDIGIRISYKDFDNLLWYYFKGSDSRTKKAMALLPHK